MKAAPDAVPSSVIPRILGVIASGIDDEDILQSCLDILCFLTELKQVQNNEAMLIENVSKKDMQELLDAFSRTGFTDGYFKGNLGKNISG